MEAETGVKTSNARSHQKLEETRMSPPTRACRGVWSHPHLDFRLLASRTFLLVKYLFVFVYLFGCTSGLGCGTWDHQPLLQRAVSLAAACKLLVAACGI